MKVYILSEIIYLDPHTYTTIIGVFSENNQSELSSILEAKKLQYKYYESRGKWIKWVINKAECDNLEFQVETQYWDVTSEKF
jgi:hypothetical protein